jgi:hypothetical protein
MKRIFLLTVLALWCQPAFAQDFQIKCDAGTAKTIPNGQLNTTIDEIDPVLVFEIKGPRRESTKTYDLWIDSRNVLQFPDDGEFHSYDSGSSDIRGLTISIKDGPNTLSTFVLVNPSATTNGASNAAKTPTSSNPGGLENNSPGPKTSALEWLFQRYGSFTPTTHGLKIGPDERVTNPPTSYVGDKYVHLFFDRFGNSLLSTIPQGIANLQYVVHIVYLKDVKNPTQVSYSIKQTAGSFDTRLVFQGAGQLDQLRLDSGSLDEPQWDEIEWLLSTSTSDIQFDIIVSTEAQANQVNSTVLQSHTIKMSPVYHGSFTVGLVNSELANPTYELVPLPSDPTKYTAKESSGGNRGFAMAMVTLYTSPIIWIEWLWRRDEIPPYKYYGRNLLDDHHILERFFPAVGVGLTDKVFENLLFGVNWEFARGGSLFVGGHYGKVNTFTTPSDFQFGQSEITPEQFNFTVNTAWETGFAIGVSVDLLIATNLFTKQ